MEREDIAPGVIELGTASTDTEGLPVADIPEKSGFRIQGLDAD